MLLCLHWSGPVCIIFWTECCLCQSVVMVIYAFIVSIHRSEGCRKITHPPDCCSGPLNPPAVTPKLHHKLSFFSFFWGQLDHGGFTQRERAAGICHPLYTADVPLHCHLYLPRQTLLPASFCKAWWEQDPLHRRCPFSRLDWSWRGEQGGDRGREGPLGLDDGCHSDWTGAGREIKIS